MMKKILALLLGAILFITGCSFPIDDLTESSYSEIVPNNSLEQFTSNTSISNSTFTEINDPSFLQYLEDNVYSGIVENLASDDYIIKTVSIKYLSKEYLEETAYNSQENIFFGYTLSDLDSYFGDSKYVFTVGEDGKTIVQKLVSIAEKDYYDRIIKNVIIGAGVILVCVVITVASEGAGAPAAAAIFAASAKTATACALSGAVISGVSAGLIRAYQTDGDFNESFGSAAVSASEGFKWGAISGAISGGVSEAISIHATAASQVSATAIPTPREAELNALSMYGGKEQVSYLAGKEVPWGTPNATRPDIIRTVGDHLEAIEVKRYDLESNFSQLMTELRRQVGQRLTDLPSGTTQRIALDVTGRGYSSSFKQSIVDKVQSFLSDLYPSIPVDIIGG